MVRIPLEQRLEKLSNRAGTAVASPPRQASEATTKLAALRTEALTEAEKILWERLDSIDLQAWHGGIRYHFLPEELHVFDLLGWDKEKIKSEASRLHTIRTWQRVAGSSDEREASRERSIEAAASLAKDAPGITEQIAELQAKLRTLEQTATSTAADFSRREDAVSKLRGFVPEHVREQYDAAQAAIVQCYPRIGEIKTRIKNIGVYATYDIKVPDGKRAANLAATVICPSIVRTATDEYIDATGWRNLVTKMQAEIPDLEHELSELVSAREADCAEADKLLNFCIPQA